MSKKAILNYAAHVLAYRAFFGLDGDVQCVTQKDAEWINKRAREIIARLAQERLESQKATVKHGVTA